MLNVRKWEILAAVTAEKPIDTIAPPLSTAEMRYYEEILGTYRKITPNLATGVPFQVVPTTAILPIGNIRHRLTIFPRFLWWERQAV